MTSKSTLLCIFWVVSACSEIDQSQAPAAEYAENDESSFLQVKVEMAPGVAERAARAGETQRASAQSDSEANFAGEGKSNQMVPPRADDAARAVEGLKVALANLFPDAVWNFNPKTWIRLGSSASRVAIVPNEVSKASESVALVQNELTIDPQDIYLRRSGEAVPLAGPAHIFKHAPPKDWAVLAGTCLVLFLLDAFAMQKLPDSPVSNVSKVLIWIALALVFDAWIWWSRGDTQALEWVSGYVLECMLSLDNLFVFHVIFRTFKTPQEQIHKAVFVGIVGAVLLRLLFFVILGGALQSSFWIRCPFGLMLIWSGIQTALAGDEDADDDVKDMWCVWGLKTLLGDRLHNGYDNEGASLFVRNAAGRVQATLLFIVVCCLEVGDLVFAVDSVTAKLAGIPNRYISFSSSVLAMFGLRAMFFIVEDLVKTFHLLNWGLCIILVFIGFHLTFSMYIVVSGVTQCILYIAVFLVCIVGSFAQKQMLRRRVSEHTVENPGLQRDDADLSGY